MLRRIIFDRNTAYVHIHGRVFTLGTVLQGLSQKAGTNIDRVGRLSGLDHATVYNLKTDKTNALKPFLRLLDELGYEAVIIKKREEQ